jgi:hypothetical protein
MSGDVPPTLVFVGSHEYVPELFDDALRRLATAHPGVSQLVLAIEMVGRGGDTRWVTELPQAMFVNPTPVFKADLAALLAELRKP